MHALTQEQVMDLLKDPSLGYVDKAVFLNDIARNFPPILETKHVKDILSISAPTAQRLLREAQKTKVFPVAKTSEKKGGRYKVPRDPFLRYVFLGEVHPVGLRFLQERLNEEEAERRKEKKERVN